MAVQITVNPSMARSELNVLWRDGSNNFSDRLLALMAAVHGERARAIFNTPFFAENRLGNLLKARCIEFLRDAGKLSTGFNRASFHQFDEDSLVALWVVHTLYSLEARFYREEHEKVAGPRNMIDSDCMQEVVAYATWHYAIRFAVLFYTDGLRKEFDLPAYQQVKALAEKHALDPHKHQSELKVAQLSQKMTFEGRTIQATADVEEKARECVDNYLPRWFAAFRAGIDLGRNPGN